MLNRSLIVLLKLSSSFALRPTLFNRKFRGISIAMSSSGNLASLETFGNSADNSIYSLLVEKQVNELRKPAEILGAHFVQVDPEPVNRPHTVIASVDCATSIGLNPSESEKDEFARVFAGNKLVPGLDQPFATIYGCHCYGNWFGQLGDGRAISLGEVAGFDSDGNKLDFTYELQLKGCGRTPFSRGFDGKAVLRSSIREFLVSEAMHHLRLPTTRALSVVGTGELVQRPWYGVSTDDMIARIGANEGKPVSASSRFPPNRLVEEPGAVVCRVSRSFLRFSHLELFAMRKEHDLLRTMADYVCYREYPELLALQEQDRYVTLFREVVKSSASLVANWLRVGYTQGNMNSDNTLLGGRTVDYGPYGWMERYDPNYQPFTSDADRKFAFVQQPQAMAVNCMVLGESFKVLIEQVVRQSRSFSDKEKSELTSRLEDQIDSIGKEEFSQCFWNTYADIRRRKLGLVSFESKATGTIPEESLTGASLWNDLERLMIKSRADYTLTFRALADVADSEESESAMEKLIEFNPFYETGEDQRGCEGGDVVVPSVADVAAWKGWLDRYLRRIRMDNQARADRRAEQNQANPRYVLRNWMATLAYERATRGDYSVVKELHELLRRPYDDQTEEARRKWSQRTPYWARSMPGVAFMSCSS